MPKISAKNAILLFNGYNFSIFSDSYEASSVIEPVDVTGFSEGVHTYVAGLEDGVITHDMFWDSAANSIVPVFDTPGVTGVHTLLPEGYGANGDPSINMPFTQLTFRAAGDVGGALRAGSIEFRNRAATSPTSYGVEYGWVLHHATITDTTTTTGILDPSDGAVTAACSGTLQIWDPTVTDTYVVKIQHSTLLGSGYADLITFTLNGTARNAERIVVASGTVNKYRRVVATRTGTGDDFGFTVHLWHG